MMRDDEMNENDDERTEYERRSDAMWQQIKRSERWTGGAPTLPLGDAK